AAGCVTLADHLKKNPHPGRTALLFGAMKDKDHRRMLGAFDGLVDRIIYTAPPLARAADPQHLVRLRKGTIARSIPDALARARRAAGERGRVVVAGSIFLVAEVRALATGVRTDPPIAM
ncbi:MAG: hypothetical protein WBG86_10025, partial [Polyangiales bacterium]